MTPVFVVTVSDVIGLVALGLLLIALLPIWVMDMWKKFKLRNCKHEKYWVDGGAQAWCMKCNKHLGFCGKLPNEGRV